MKRIFKTISVIITLICLVIFGTFNAKAEDQNHILTSNKMWGKDALLTGNVTFDLNGHHIKTTQTIYNQSDVTINPTDLQTLQA